MRAGSHSARSGHSAGMSSRTNMSRWYGMVPSITSLSSPSQMLWMTNRLMPIGGELRPSSMNVTRTTPNQIGSKP